MGALSNNLSSVSGAVSVSCSLLYHIAKDVGYKNISKSMKNIFDRRLDLGVLKTVVVRSLVLLVNLEKMTNLGFLSRHKAQMEIVCKEVKGYASVFSDLPVPIFKLINLMGGGVAKGSSTYKSLFFYKGSGVQSRLLDMANVVRFSKGFSEGFSFLSSKILNGVSLEKYSPMSSKLMSWIVNEKSSCLAFAINSFYSFKDVYAEGVEPVNKVVENLSKGKGLDDKQKALVLNVLRGVDFFSTASVCLVNILQEKVGKYRVFEVFCLIMTAVAVGAGMAAASMTEASVVKKEPQA